MLAGIVLVVRYKFSGELRELGGGGLLDESEHDARLIQHHQQLADDRAKAQAAQVDSDIEAFRDRGRRREAAVRSSETAQLRQLLDDRTNRTT